jgi:hypothetical protein
MSVPAATYIGPNPYLDRGVPGFPFGPDQAGPETGLTRDSTPEQEVEAGPPLQRKTAISPSQAAGLTENIVQDILVRPSWLVSRIHDPGRASLLGHSYV